MWLLHACFHAVYSPKTPATATAGNPYRRRGLSTLDLLVLASLYQLLLILQTLFTFCKKSCLNEEVKRTKPSPSLVFPGNSTKIPILVL
jgi:hypothetical protein